VIRILTLLTLGGTLLASTALAGPSIQPRKVAAGLHDGSTFGPKLKGDGNWVAYGVREERRGTMYSLYYRRSLVEDAVFKTVWPNKHPSFKPKEGPNSFSDLVGFEWHPGGVHNAMIVKHKREGNDILIEEMKLRFGGEGDDEQAFFTDDGAAVVATVRSPLGTDLWYSEVRPGARPEQLTWTRDFERWPDWHPTERLVLHEMYDRKQGDLFTFKIEGFEQLPLLQLPDSDEVRPSWHPDGERYAYLSNRAHPGTKVYDLYVGKVGVEAEEHIVVIEAVRVSDDSQSYCWAPDGRYLLAITDDKEANYPFVVAPVDGTRKQAKLPISVDNNIDPSLRLIANEDAEAPRQMRLSWVAPDPERKRGDATWNVVYVAEFDESILLKLAGVK
jgi:hypothetical protein